MKEEEELLDKEISQIEELLSLVKRQEKAALEKSRIDRLSLLLKEGDEKAEKLKELHQKVELLLTGAANQKKIEKRDYLLKELFGSAAKVEDLIKEEMDHIKEELILLSGIKASRGKDTAGERSYFIDKRR